RREPAAEFHSVKRLPRKGLVAWRLSARKRNYNRQSSPCPVLDRATDGKAGAGALASKVFEDSGDVVLRFPVRRDAAIAADGRLARVIRGDRERQLESLEQELEIPRAAFDVRA